MITPQNNGPAPASDRDQNQTFTGNERNEPAVTVNTIGAEIDAIACRQQRLGRALGALHRLHLAREQDLGEREIAVARRTTDVYYREDKLRRQEVALRRWHVALQRLAENHAAAYRKEAQ